MDEDVQEMSRAQLVAEVKRLRQGIRQHRDSTGHELCWYHPALWALLPDATEPLPTVPDWPQFLQGCIRYRGRVSDVHLSVVALHDLIGMTVGQSSGRMLSRSLSALGLSMTWR